MITHTCTHAYKQRDCKKQKEINTSVLTFYPQVCYCVFQGEEAYGPAFRQNYTKSRSIIGAALIHNEVSICT